YGADADLCWHVAGDDCGRCLSYGRDGRASCAGDGASAATSGDGHVHKVCVDLVTAEGIFEWLRRDDRRGGRVQWRHGFSRAKGAERESDADGHYLRARHSAVWPVVCGARIWRDGDGSGCPELSECAVD